MPTPEYLIVSNITARDALEKKEGMIVVVQDISDDPTISDEYIHAAYTWVDGEWVIVQKILMEVETTWNYEPPCDEGNYWICTVKNECSIVYVSFNEDDEIVVQKIGDPKTYTLDELGDVVWMSIKTPLLPGEKNYD